MFYTTTSDMSQIPEPTIVRSSRSTLTIHITRTGEVVVKAPRFLPKFMITKFVQEKQEWITKAVEKIQQHQPKQKQFANGEKFLYLGKEYELKIDSSKEIHVNDVFHFPNFLLFNAKKELTKWYLRQAKKFITDRVERRATEMQTTYKSIMFSDTSSKWGTCGPDNSLQFNWRLIMTPAVVLDYVVIHELAHTMEKNHGPRFWKLVATYTPAYKTHRKWLNNNAYLLHF